MLDDRQYRIVQRAMQHYADECDRPKGRSVPCWEKGDGRPPSPEEVKAAMEGLAPLVENQDT
jgi:hypothetical protein